MIRSPYCAKCLVDFGVQHGDEPLLWTDQGGRLLHANRAATRLLGYSLKQLRFMDLQQLDGKLAQVFARGNGNGGGSFQGEAALLTSDGTTVPAQVTMTSARRCGRSFYCAAVCDLRRRRAADEQMRRSQQLAVLAQAVAGLAHDFNNELTTVLVQSGLLLSELNPRSPLAKRVAQIEAAAERGARLIARLLEIGRPATPQPKLLSLPALLESLGGVLPALLGPQVELEIAANADPPAVQADPVELERVLLNLALNARDAMLDGGRFRLSAERVELSEEAARALDLEPGVYARLTAADTGRGMDEDTRQHAFEAFFTTKQGGTGLGLASVKEVVERSGGRVRLSSAAGQGTEVCLYFPAAAGPAAAEHRGRVLRMRGNETILLVEDDDAVRQPLREWLVRSGYNVLQARHAIEGLMVAGRYRGPIHLLVTDLVMPGVTGYDLADRLLQVRPNLQVLYVSGRSRELTELRQPFLAKPFTPADLARRVREILGASSLRGEGKKC